MVPLLEYHAMPSQQAAEEFNWGTLINTNKSPSPLFEQLCLGIADLISKWNTPTGIDGLTPEKLAAFYRAVGGNFDTLFLSTPPCSLSFIYKSMGCFHTLQPTPNAFEAPSIPALLPEGFVRWQTIQLLLCPDEHAEFLREAVRQFDIVNPSTGSIFPKDIPRYVFPAEPDPEMTQWHNTVGTRLEREYTANQIRAASRQRSRHREEGHEEQHHARSHSSGRKSEAPRADYFSSKPRLRPEVARTSSHEGYSPRSRPPNRSSHIDDTRELDSDGLDQATPKFYVVNSEEESEPRHRSRRHSRPSSRQSRTRSRSRASSKRRHHRRKEFNDSPYHEADGDYQRGRAPSTKRSHYRTHASRSTDGRRLQPRVLSPEPSVHVRRHSHESPYPLRNGSIPAHRPHHSPRHSRDRISVEILSDTEPETDLSRTTSNESPRRSRGYHNRRSSYDEDELEPTYASHYSPDSKRARDYYYGPNSRFDAPRSYSHPNLNSQPHQQPQQKQQHYRQRHHRAEPEYIILQPSTSSESTSSTSPPPSPARSKKYKEYIIVGPGGTSPTSNSSTSTAASADHYAHHSHSHAHGRRPSIPTAATTNVSGRARSQSRYRQSPVRIATSSGGPQLSQRRSIKTLNPHQQQQQRNGPIPIVSLSASHTTSSGGGSGYRGTRYA